MSAAPLSPLLVLALVLIPLIIGLVLLRHSRRRVGSAPHCPRCDYLLYGNITAVCPECGHALTPDNIVHGERRRRRRQILFGNSTTTRLRREREPCRGNSRTCPVVTAHPYGIR